MTSSTCIPGDTRIDPAAKLTDLPSTDLMTTGLGLNSAVLRDAPSISAVSDFDVSEESIVSVTPQPTRSMVVINTAGFIAYPIIWSPDDGWLGIGFVTVGLVPDYTTP